MLGFFKKNEKETEYKVASFFAIFLAFIFLLSFLVQEIYSWDIWFHLKAGEWIVSNLKAPSTDMFSYTVPSHSYLDSHWLFQALLFLIYEHLGTPGLQFFKIFVSLFTFYFIFKIGGRRYLAITSVVFFLTVLLIQSRFFIRPELITFFFVSAYLFIFYKFPNDNFYLFVILPIFQLLWVNMHGLNILGPVILTSFLAGNFFSHIFLSKCSWYQGTIDGEGKNKKFLLLLGVFFCISFLNPYGLEGALYPFLIFSEIGPKSNVWLQRVSELYPTLSTSNDFTFFFCYWTFIVLAFLTFFLNLKKINAASLLLFGGFLFISLLANRNVSLLAIVLAFVSLTNIQAASKDLFFLRDHNFRKKINILVAVFMVPLLVFWISKVVTNTYYLENSSVRRFGFGVSEGRYPKDAVDFLEENNIKGNMFNAHSIGGYLIWRLSPGKKVFIDGRWEVYGVDFLQEFNEAVENFGALSRLLEKYEINYILINHYSTEAKQVKALYDSPKWNLIYLDDTASIFLKKSPENEQLNKLYNPLVERKTNEKVLQEYPNTSLAKGFFYHSIGDYQKALSIYNISVKKNSRNSKLYNNRAVTYTAMGRHNDAIKDLTQAIKIQPDNLEAYLNRGIVYMQYGKGNIDLALEDFDRAIEIKDDYVEALNNRGLAYEHKGLFEKAIRDYNKAISINPTKSDSFSHRAVAYWKTGKKEESFQDMNKALSLNPENQDALLSMGIAYMETGQLKKALAEFDKLIMINPSDKTVFKYRDIVSSQLK